VRDHTIEIPLDVHRLHQAAVEDPAFWLVAFEDPDGRSIHRQDADPHELSQLLALPRSGDRITLVREFESEAAPASWIVWPYSASRGWLERLSGAIAA
jgi:hypothetical protein